MTKNQGPRQRFKTEKIILVSLSVLVLILTASLLFVAIKLAGCVMAAAQILTYVDPTADPCDDFFQFACGRYLQDNFGDLEAAPMVQLQKRVERQVEEIIVEPIKDDDHYLVKMQKELLKACLNETKAEEEALLVFQKLLDELQGWPVVVRDRWKDEVFDWKDIICKLRQKGYAFSMMLTVGPVVDPSNTSRYIIRVEQAYIPSINARNKELYKNYMSDVAVIFGAERRYAEEEMEKVLDFMERLRKLGEKNEWKIQNGNDQNQGLLSNRHTVEEFQNRFNQINWLDLLNKILHPAAQISNTDYVIFPEDAFLQEFFILLGKTPKRTQANYIIWIALINIMPYMPRELQQSSQNHTFLTTEPSMERLDFCRREISQGFFPDPSKILYVRKYLPIGKRDQVAQLLTSIKSELIYLLRKSPWLDEVSKQKSVKKAEALVGVIGAPGDYSNEEELEKFEFEPNMNFSQGSFLEMFLGRLKEVVDAAFYRLHKSSDDTKLAPFYNLLTKVLAINSWTENAVFLSAGILQGIFYDQDRPMCLNYGGIGSVIGHELTHGFGKDGSRFDEDGNERNWWLEETEKGFAERTKCLLQDAEGFHTHKINGQQTLEENIADYTGVKVSYAAYKKWVNENGKEEHLVGVKYTPYQLFWISSVLHYCYKTNGEASDGTGKSVEHANNVFRTIAPLQNNADFAKDFKCAVGSRMNPLEKCQVF